MIVSDTVVLLLRLVLEERRHSVGPMQFTVRCPIRSYRLFTRWLPHSHHHPQISWRHKSQTKLQGRSDVCSTLIQCFQLILTRNTNTTTALHSSIIHNYAVFYLFTRTASDLIAPFIGDYNQPIAVRRHICRDCYRTFLDHIYLKLYIF